MSSGDADVAARRDVADPPRGPASRQVFSVLLVVYLLVRVGLGSITGDKDSQYYQDWAYGIATSGIAAAYESTSVDYPPLVLYVFYPIGKIYRHFVPEYNSRRLYESVPFRLLIKTPHIVFDLLIAALLYGLVARRGIWFAERARPEWGRLAALLYLWQPAVLWGSAYWGQLDAIHTALLIAALTALGSQRLAFAAALFAASALMKPLAAPLLPLLVGAAAAARGLRGIAATGAGGLAVGAILFLPFIVTGRSVSTARIVFGDLNSMPFTSVSGHNLWMIAGAWEPSTEPLLGPLSAQGIGLLLFAAAATPLLVRSWSWLGGQGLAPSDYLARLFLLAAAIYCCFFFATNMHENHLFQCAPLLLMLAGRSRSLAAMAAACSAAVFLNMALHDLDLIYNLPLGLDTPSPLIDPYHVFDTGVNPTIIEWFVSRGGEFASGSDVHYTWLQVVGIVLNTALILGLTGATYLRCWRRQV